MSVSSRLKEHHRWSVTTLSSVPQVSVHNWPVYQRQVSDRLRVNGHLDPLIQSRVKTGTNDMLSLALILSWTPVSGSEAEVFTLLGARDNSFLLAAQIY